MGKYKDEDVIPIPQEPRRTYPDDEVIYAPQHENADRRYGLARLAGGIPSAGQWLAERMSGVYAVGEEDRIDPETGQRIPYIDTGKTLTKWAADALDTEKPSTLEGEKRAMQIEGLGYTALTLPFVGPAIGAVEAAGAVLGPEINLKLQNMLRKSDETPGQSILREGVGLTGEVLAGVLAPVGMATTLRNAPSKINRMRLAAQATPEIKALASRLGVKPADLFKETEEIKRLFPKSPDGTESIIEEAATRLEKVADQFPDPHYRPRTLQALDNDIARQNLSNAEEALGKLPGSTKKWVPELEGRQVFLEKDVQRRMDELQFEGSAPGLQESFGEGSGVVRRQATERWKEADPLLDQYDVLSDETQEIARNMVEQATEYGDIPALITRLANETDKPVHTLREIQSMQSQLKASIRAAEMDPTKAPAAHWAGRMLDHLKKVEKSIPDADVAPALRKARAATARKKDLLKPTPANKALKNEDQVHKIGLKVVNSKDDARRAVEVLGETEEGLSHLRQVVTEAIWGDDLFDMATRISPRRVRAAIKKHHDGLVEVFGQEHLDRMEELAEIYEMTARGRLGTVGAARGAGSNQPSAVALLAPAASATNPAMMSVKAIAKMIAKIEANPKGMKIFQEFFADPETAALLLRTPTDRGKAAWVLGWKKLIARGTARGAVTNDASQAVEDYLGGK